MRFGTLLAGLAAIGWSTSSAQSGAVRELRLVEEFRIDGNDQEWSRIDAIHVAKNGTIYVRHPGDFAMSMFTARGQLVKQFARKGDGPGEVRSPSTSGLVGDSLYISETGLRRLSLYDLEGTPGRVIRPVNSGDWIKTYAPAANYTSQVFVPARLLPNNVGIGGGFVDVRRLESGEVKSLALLRMTWDGNATGVVAEKGFGAFPLRVQVPGQLGAIGRQPFVADPVSVFSPAGHVAFVDAEERPAPTIVVRHFSIKGDTTRVVRLPYAARPVTSAMIDSVVSALAKSLKREGHEDLVRKAIVLPKFDWPIGQAALGDDGTTWIQIRGTTPTAEWLVVSPQGRLVGRLMLPRSTEILLVQDGIWAVVKDQDDVPSVVRYRLR